ncbi:MAG: DEAD/DEAH box helicase [Desulfobacterium sp.]|nr:DEAD/DEAH box helicase [Desulfobacterium sp.]
MKFELKYKLVLSELTPETREHVKRDLTMANPLFNNLVRLDKQTYGTPRQLYFFEEQGDSLVLPRGSADQVYRICLQHGEEINVIDERRILPPVSFDSKGNLKPFQSDAVQAILPYTHGVLSSGTGSGKTVMALVLIAERKQPTLIIVHTKELLHQWVERAGQFLGMDPGEIGIIGNGKFALGDRVTVGMVQTLCKRVDEVKDRFGHIVVDECHRCPSKTFLDVMTAFDARFLLGLTATAYRRDGLSQVIFWHLGDRRHEVQKEDLLDQGDLCQAQVVWHRTSFDTVLNASEQYSRVLSELTQDQARNRQICGDVAAENNPGIKLVLSDRKAHCQELQRILKEDHGIDAAVLVGGLSQKARTAVSEQIRQGKVDVLICTGQLIGEGYDLPELSVLFLATPIKFSGRLIQYVGRILRPSPGKDLAVIHDYADSKVGVLDHSAKARQQTYQQEKIAA